MDRKQLKALISEIVQEISTDTIRKAAQGARNAGKYAQANRFYDAAEKREGADFGKNLTDKLGNAPRKFKMELPTGAISTPSHMVEVTLTGLYVRGYTMYIKFQFPTWFGFSKNDKGLIIYNGKDGEFYVSTDDLNSMPSNAKFDRNGVIAMHKLTGVANERIPKVDTLKEKREMVKESIRKIILSEITKSDFGTGKVSTEKELEKQVKKSVGSAGEAVENPLNGKVSVDDEDGGKKFQAEITENGKGLFDVNIVKNDGDRVTGRQLSAEKLAEFLKTHSKEEDSYVEKAHKKGKAPIKKEEEEQEEVSSKTDDSDEMEETDEKKQVDIADKDTKKAEEKADKDLAPVSKDEAPELGGELVDKIEKIIDRVLKDKTKADSKTAHLKADKDMESPDKLSVKMKDTPALKEKKK